MLVPEWFGFFHARSYIRPSGSNSSQVKSLHPVLLEGN